MNNRGYDLVFNCFIDILQLDPEVRKSCVKTLSNIALGNIWDTDYSGLGFAGNKNFIGIGLVLETARADVLATVTAHGPQPLAQYRPGNASQK